MKYSCAIMEEEPLARQLLERYINQAGQLELKWKSNFIDDTIARYEAEPVDLMFLNIRQLPIKTDSDFFRFVDHADHDVIITTAYPVELLGGVKLKAIAFLNKPVTYEKFETAVHAFIRKQKERKDEQP